LLLLGQVDEARSFLAREMPGVTRLSVIVRLLSLSDHFTDAETLRTEMLARAARIVLDATDSPTSDQLRELLDACAHTALKADQLDLCLTAFLNAYLARSSRGGSGPVSGPRLAESPTGDERLNVVWRNLLQDAAQPLEARWARVSRDIASQLIHLSASRRGFVPAGTASTSHSSSLLAFPHANVYLDAECLETLREITDCHRDRLNSALAMLQRRGQEPLNPDRFTYRMAHVCCLWWSDRRKEAVELLQATCREHPEDPHLRLAWAVALFNTGQLRESLAQVELLSNLGATPPADLNRLRSEIADRWSTIAKLRDLEGRSGVIRSIAFSPDNRFVATASVDRTVRVWTISDGALAAVLKEPADMALCVAFSPDGRLLASSGYDRIIRFWSLPDFKPLPDLDGHQDIVRGIAFSPDSTKLVSVGDERTLYVWDVSHMRLDAKRPVDGENLTTVKFSADGRHVASASAAGELRIWDASDFRALLTVPSLPGTTSALAFLPHANQLIHVTDVGTLRRLDLETQQSTEFGKLAGARSLDCTRDGKFIAVGCSDGTLKLVDVQSAETWFGLNAQLSSDSVIAFSGDGQLVASASYDGGVRLWMSEPSRSLLTGSLSK
jgi:hypothetical protein